MEEWQQRALERFPELREDLEEDDPSIYMLFFDLLVMVEVAHVVGDSEELNRIYAFAQWCLQEQPREVSNAAAVGFYEHLVDRRDRRNWAEVLPWLPSSVIAKIWPLWQWRLAEHEEGVLRDLIAQPDLTPPLLARRTVDPAPVPVHPSVVDLGTLGGRTSHAWAINKAGTVVGWAETASWEQHAVAWREGRPIDLGTLGGANSGALAVNDAGTVIGWAETAAGATHASRWDSGRAVDLGTLGGQESIALAINRKNQIVGWARTSDGARHAVLWERGRATDLGTLGGRESVALAINVSGVVVGWAETAEGEMHAARWERGRVIDLGTLGGRDCCAVAINDQGWIAGWAEASVETDDGAVSATPVEQATRRLPPPSRGGGATAKAIKRAVLWVGGQVIALGTLGGTHSEAAAVSPTGEVVGWAKASGEEYEPFFDVGYSKTMSGQTAAARWVGGAVSELCANGLWSQAFAVNAAGQVVGWVRHRDGGTRAFRWQDGVTTDLGTLGGTESIALGVNAAGAIVGRAEAANGDMRAVLWVPARSEARQSRPRWLRVLATRWPRPRSGRTPRGV